jgi:hypothetical protein
VDVPPLHVPFEQVPPVYAIGCRTMTPPLKPQKLQLDVG